MSQASQAALVYFFVIVILWGVGIFGLDLNVKLNK